MLDELVTKKFCISDDFFAPSLCRALLSDLRDLRQNDQLRAAGIGRGQQTRVQTKIRGDHIFWLPENPVSPAQEQFSKQMAKLQQDINRNFFLSLKHFEAHFAWYPPETGYQKHIDQHAGTRFRQITFVLYLNENWQKQDGGELILYKPESPNEILEEIEPRFGRLILFRSEVFPHQVQNSHVDRHSLTGWFRNDEASRAMH